MSIVETTLIFAGIPAALVSGRYLTWYGPSLEQAPAALSAQLEQGALIVPERQSDEENQ